MSYFSFYYVRLKKKSQMFTLPLTLTYQIIANLFNWELIFHD